MTRTEVIQKLQGIICPVVTPFNRRGDVDEGHFRENVTRLGGMGLAGILIAGSTGEAPYLGETERLRLIDIARAVVKPPELLLAGTGLESTSATLKLSREAVARGADALLVLTPNYYKSRMDSAALVAHYRAVGAGLTRPVLIYSIPQFTGLEVDPETIGNLSKLDNVVGLKESSGNLEFVKGVLARVRSGFRVMVGAPSITYDSLCAGAVGAVLGVANFAPALCVALYEAYLDRRPDEARKLQQELAPLGQKITQPFGVPGVKVALDLCGYRGGYPRLPLLPASPQARKQIATTLKASKTVLAV